MRNIGLLLILVFFSICILSAQDSTNVSKNNKVNIGAELNSRYIWRGIQLADGPCIQPFIEYQCNNFKIGSWASYSLISTKGTEFDIYISYSLLNEMFSIAVWDYFFPNENGVEKFFDYDKNSTKHIIEPTITYNGTEKFPLYVSASCNVFGADAKKVNNDINSSDFNKEVGNQYSFYFEAGYNFNCMNTKSKIFIGGTPNNPKNSDLNTGFIGENGYYAKKSGLINCGISSSKEIKINDNYSIPFKVSVLTNPIEEKVFFVMGLSF